ncbi:MAG: phosphoenolpyruvate synthase [Segetibacter sp.]|nr:phosphoenolpyruvate synthase [Segetibacter sp.]
MLPVIKMFPQINMNDIPFVDSHIAAPEMNSNLTVQSINMPQAFLVTAEAFSIFLRENSLQLPLSKILEELDTQKFSNIGKIGQAARQLVLNNELPHCLEVEIKNAHYKLCGEETNISVTVQGSSIIKKSPSTVFTYQSGSFSNIRGEDALTNAVHKCFVSLFSEALIRDLQSNTINPADIAITISVQKMTDANLSSNSVNQAFTFDHLKSFNKIMSFKTVEQGSSL